MQLPMRALINDQASKAKGGKGEGDKHRTNPSTRSPPFVFSYSDSRPFLPCMTVVQLLYIAASSRQPFACAFICLISTVSVHLKTSRQRSIQTAIGAKSTTSPICSSHPQIVVFIVADDDSPFPLLTPRSLQPKHSLRCSELFAGYLWKYRNLKRDRIWTSFTSSFCSSRRGFAVGRLFVKNTEPATTLLVHGCEGHVGPSPSGLTHTESPPLSRFFWISKKKNTRTHNWAKDP
ncbi:MAG: hypothetical protein J3R72DRAFT_460522 [Linnemannia gamsii]|nr:MAG: hypothetical protein J3R72DRAFT_460522 [Linnemannia gamsii]